MALVTRGCLAGLVTALLIVGCSDGPGGDEPGVAEAGQDEAHWLLPLDAYYHPLSVPRRDFAYSRVFSPCMLERGFDLGSMPPPSYPYEGVTVNDTGRQLFNLAVAERYGYAGPPQTPPPQTAPDILARLDTDEGQAATNSCAEMTQQVVPPAPSSELLSSLGAAAYSSAKESDAVQSAANRWRACMAPLGVPDLPSGPESMQSDTQRERFEPERGNDGTAGPDEVREAVVDAECRRSSGWSTALYQEEWDRQRALLEENEDALERLRAANAEHAALIEQALAGLEG